MSGAQSIATRRAYGVQRVCRVWHGARSSVYAAKHGTRFGALEPIRQGMRERFGGIGDGGARGLRLRHDHGSNDRADDFQQEVAFFGIDSSPSFVREPEGNGVAERFIRTLKENLLWVRRFATIEDLRLALLAFKRTYVDAGEIRPSKPRPGATRPRRAGKGSVDANTVKPLSKNPGAVHPGGSGNGSVEEGAGSWVGADAAAAGARALAPGQRWSASRTRDVVLRLLCGESLDAVSRAVGVEIYRLEEWKVRALAGLELGLKEQAGEPVAAVRMPPSDRLGNCRWRTSCCGSVPAWRSVASLWRRGGRDDERNDLRDHGSALWSRAGVSDAQLLAAIRTDLARSPFQGEGHRKVHAWLRILDRIRVSRTRVLRVMRAQGLLSPHRGRQGDPKAHDGTIVTSAPQVM